MHFLLDVHKLERIVLITHYGCAFYAELLGTDPEGCISGQQADVRAAAANLGGWFGSISVEGYLAMRIGDELSFRRVDL